MTKTVIGCMSEQMWNAERRGCRVLTKAEDVRVEDEGADDDEDDRREEDNGRQNAHGLEHLHGVRRASAREIRGAETGVRIGTGTG
jgi:hypothetical protein